MLVHDVSQQAFFRNLLDPCRAVILACIHFLSAVGGRFKGKHAFTCLRGVKVRVIPENLNKGQTRTANIGDREDVRGLCFGPKRLGYTLLWSLPYMIIDLKVVPDDLINRAIVQICFLKTLSR